MDPFRTRAPEESDLLSFAGWRMGRNRQSRNQSTSHVAIVFPRPCCTIAPVIRSVAVLIPALNEERRIAACVESARAAGATEVVVSDAGSDDRTAEIATAAGAKVLSSVRMRSRQLNAAAAGCSSDALIFLHADTTLPSGAALLAADALNSGNIFGGFRISFTERESRLRIAEVMINLRTQLTRCPWGDQAQFLSRETFLRLGGFREIPMMEDYDLAIRMKRQGPTVVLPQKVQTSGRRFLKKGVLRTAATNWRIILAYRLGTDPAELERIYRK